MQSGKGVVHLTELESGDYKSICENLYDGIHITDGTGTILFINKAYTRTTGILPEELLGRKVSEIEAEGILYTGSVRNACWLKARESTLWPRFIV